MPQIRSTRPTTLADRIVTALGMLLLAGPTFLICWWLWGSWAPTFPPLWIPEAFIGGFVVLGFLAPVTCIKLLGGLWQALSHLS